LPRPDHAYDREVFEQLAKSARRPSIERHGFHCD
jgi:hypothetical protein